MKYRVGKRIGGSCFWFGVFGFIHGRMIRVEGCVAHAVIQRGCSLPANARHGPQQVHLCSHKVKYSGHSGWSGKTNDFHPTTAQTLC